MFKCKGTLITVVMTVMSVFLCNTSRICRGVGMVFFDETDTRQCNQGFNLRYLIFV